MRRSTLLAIGAYLLLRWVLATLPGYVYDVKLYKNWALYAARDGVEEVYAQRSGMDYPPLYAYILWPLGKVYLAAAPEAAAALDEAMILDSPLLTILVKLPCLLFDLAIAGMLVLWTRALPRGGEPDRWTRLLPWFYLLNPAVLFDSAYWGQPDSVHSAFVLAAFLWFARGRTAWPAWVLLTLATLMKPLGAPFFPLLAAVSLARTGFRATLVGGLAAGATALLVFAPFLLTGRMAETTKRVVGDVGAMSYTSTNAHNLWWALGGWRDSHAPWLGPVTPTQFALALLAIFYLGVLLLGHRLHGRGWNLAALVPRPNPRGGITAAQSLGLAFLVGFGFFMLSTQMHENHMFVVLPLLLPLTALPGPSRRWTRGLFLAATLAVLLNLVLHDLDPVRQDMPKLGLLAAGGPSGVENVHLRRPFFVAELWAIRLSLWFNLALFGAVLLRSFRPGGWIDALGDAPAQSANPDGVPR